MRKFLHTLEKAKIPEWDPFYINLEKITHMSTPLKNKKNETTLTALNFKIDLTNSALIDRVHESNKELLPLLQDTKDLLISELNKVYIFCTENLIYYNRRIQKISEQLKFIRTTPLENYQREKNQLEVAIKELYKEVSYITGFMDINYNCEKLIVNKLKSYCEVIFSPNDYKKIIEQIAGYSLDILISNSKKSEIMNEINRIFMLNFFDKYQLETKKVLSKVTTSQSGLSLMQTFLFGLFVGFFSMIIFLIIIIGSKYGIDMDDDIEFKSIFPMFRGQINLCLYMWFYAFDVYLWTISGVNFRLLFGWDNHYSNFVTCLKRAACFSVIVGTMIFYYMIIRTNAAEAFNFLHVIPLKMTPLVSWVILLTYLFWPIKHMFNYQGRMWLLSTFWNLITKIRIDSPSYFVMGYFGSMIGVIRDFAFSVCFYLHYNQTYIDGRKTCDPISFEMCMISLIPPILISFLQTIKAAIYNGTLFMNSVNFLRSFFSIATIVMAFSIKNDPNYKYIWLLSSIWTAVHNFYWDVTLDWGLLQTTSKNFLLRDKLALKNHKWFYYLAICLDLLLRFLFTLLISPQVVYEFLRPEFVFMILYMGETVRRFISNYIGVEFEHINLCKTFRATKFVDTPFYKDENGKFIVKELKKKEEKEKTLDDKAETDKVTQRLNRILLETFFNKNRWIKNKDFIRRLNLNMTDLIPHKQVGDNIDYRDALNDKYNDKYNKDTELHQIIEDEGINNEVKGGLNMNNNNYSNNFNNSNHTDDDFNKYPNNISSYSISNTLNKSIRNKDKKKSSAFDSFRKHSLLKFNNKVDVTNITNDEEEEDNEKWRFTKFSYFNK